MAGILKFVANYTVLSGSNYMLAVSTGMTNVVFKAQPEEIVTHTATEVATGVYIAAGNITTSAYKLYINGVVNTAWGGSDGAYASNTNWATDDELTIVSAGRVDRAGDTLIGPYFLTYADETGSFSCIAMTGSNVSISAVPSKGYVDNQIATRSTTGSITALTGGLTSAYVSLAGPVQNITSQKKFYSGTQFDLGTSGTTAGAFRITTQSNPPNGGVIALDAGYQDNNVPFFNFYTSDLKIGSLTATSLSTLTAGAKYVSASSVNINGINVASTANIFTIQGTVNASESLYNIFEVRSAGDYGVIDFNNAQVVGFNAGTTIPDTIGERERILDVLKSNNNIVANKTYNNWIDANNSCAAAANNNEYTIAIQANQYALSGNDAIPVLNDYVNVRGIGNAKSLLMETSYASISKWSDMRVLSFNKDVTFTNMKFENMFIKATQKTGTSNGKITFGGNCELVNCIIASITAVDFVGGTNKVVNTLSTHQGTSSTTAGDLYVQMVIEPSLTALAF